MSVDPIDTVSPQRSATIQADQPDVKFDGPPTKPAASALTPPTSEDMDSKHKDNSSDLSDIEDEPEETIEPDHYYDNGKIPVFKPTMDQFRSFKKYVEKINHYGMKSGIVKVVAPQEWRDSLAKLDQLVKDIRIKNPIMQEFTGAHGTYTQANIEKQRSYNLPEWKALTEETQNQPPARRGERRRNQTKVVRGGGSGRGRGAAAASSRGNGERTRGRSSKRGGRARQASVQPAVDFEGVAPPTPTSPAVVASVEVERGAPPAKKQKAGPRQKANENSSVSSRRMNNRTEKAEYIDEEAFEGFDHKLDHLEDFTAERCAELETAYWKSLTFAAPMYAADMPGSLFTDETTSWNVAKLENLLDVLGTKVPGVNTAYLYLGMWKATFAWHLEDVDLYSINYIHFGAPKQWYSISQEDARRFEAAMRQVWPNDSKNCDQFLRHKTYLISPSLLKERYNITVNKLVHYEGEFVITYPYGYHSGYNLGYNCAESVNFALESWMEFGKIARKCECESDSVWVDVYDIERKLRGEQTPEYYEETDDESNDFHDHDLPTPPGSVTGKTLKIMDSRKRKRDCKDAGEPQKKRIRIKIKTDTREPCELCPIHAKHEPLVKCDNGKMVHRVCALYTPETWVSVQDGQELAYGVATIDKARLDLKCNFCRSKRGACFQCAHKKCTRAYHATCALAAGVQIDAGLVPTFGEDGTEYKEEGFDFRCRYHRPKRVKHVTVDTLEANKLINSAAQSVTSGECIQFQYLNYEIFAGVVIDNRPTEASFLVDIQPDGDRVEVEWKWLVVLDPKDSLRPKPSASAVPVPKDMNKQSVSIENRQDGIPTIDDIFHDNKEHRWAEYLALDQPPRGYPASTLNSIDQTRIDFGKSAGPFYYLPDMSTETKSKFADDPASKVASDKADFPIGIKPLAPLKITKLAPPKTKSNPALAPSNISSSRQSLPPVVSSRAPHPEPSAPSRVSNGQFPGDAYYSSKVLPAAVPGQYSNYIQHVRQNSIEQGKRPGSLSTSYMPTDVACVAPQVPQMGSNYAVQARQPTLALSAGTVAPVKHYALPAPPAITDLASQHSWTPPSQLLHNQSVDRATFPPIHDMMQKSQSPYAKSCTQDVPQVSTDLSREMSRTQPQSAPTAQPRHEQIIRPGDETRHAAQAAPPMSMQGILK